MSKEKLFALYKGEEFIDIGTAKEIEVGGEQCRKMGHALVLRQRNEPYFFEHNEDKLAELLKLKEKNK